MIYRMQLADSVDEMTFDLLEVPIEDKDIEGTADNTTIDGNVFTDYLWLKKQFVQKWSLMCEDDYTQLRGFYTRQWENAEVPTYKLFVGENRSETLTASGSSFQIQNGTQYDAPLTLTEITGNATQNGTPTPDAPVAVQTTTGENVVKITGKNLMQLTPYRAGSSFYNLSAGTQIVPEILSDVVLTQTSNGCAVSSSTGWRGVWFLVEVSEAKTYWLKYTQKSEQASGRTTPYTLDAKYKIVRNLGAVNSDDYTISRSITTQTGEKYIALAVGIAVHDTTCYLVEPQLELGSTATDYEPYQGQEYEVNLGKNLADPDTTNTLNAYINGSSVITANVLNRLVYYKVEPESYYTISATRVPVSGKESVQDDMQVALGSVVPADAVQYHDRQTAVLYGTNLHTSFTLYTGSYTYLALKYANTTNTDASATLATIQLERGSKETSFAPYFTPIELAKIGTYQDRIYKNDGKWYLEKQTGKVDLGTLTWAVSGSTMYTADITDYATANNIPISNYFVGQSNVGGAGAVIDNRIAFNNKVNTTQNRFYAMATSVFTTVSAFTTWLGTHNTTVYYALATPTTTEITDSTLLSQLNFIANLYGGTNNIMLVGTGAQGEIEVEYTLTYEQEQVIIPETPVRLNLTDGGVINPCGCRQNVQLTMRETVQ